MAENQTPDPNAHSWQIAGMVVTLIGIALIGAVSKNGCRMPWQAITDPIDNAGNPTPTPTPTPTATPTPTPAVTPTEYDYYLCWGERVLGQSAFDKGRWVTQTKDPRTDLTYRHPGYFVARLPRGAKPDKEEFFEIARNVTACVEVSWFRGPYPNGAQARDAPRR